MNEIKANAQVFFSHDNVMNIAKRAASIVGTAATIIAVSLLVKAGTAAVESVIAKVTDSEEDKVGE